MTARANKQLGDYRILELIGSGGMGEVYLAEHVHLRKSYAVKILPAELAGDRNFVARFHDEARVMAELRHPGIVQVHTMGSHEGVYFLAMDYVTGEQGKPLSLHEYLREKPEGRLPEQDVRKWAIQIAEALSYAHKRGVIHRDIKPANILIDSDDNVRLTDFGLAKAVGNEFILSQIHQSMQQSLGDRPTIHAGMADRVVDSLDAKETIPADGSGGSRRSSGATSILGTYDYMAPEQRGEGTGQVDERTDIYSFGVLLYRLLTGRRPAGRAKAPSQLVRGLSKRWDAIVDRCLEDDQSDRYPSVDALLGDLRSCSAPPARKRYVMAAVITVLVAVITVAALFFTRDSGKDGPPEVVQPTVEPAAVTLADVVPVKSRAETDWELVKSLDRGQGFGTLLDEADTVRRSSQTFFEREAYAEANQGYEDLLGRCKVLINMQAQRTAALTTKAEADRASGSASEAGAEDGAKHLWAGAEQLAATASKAFRQGDFDGASGYWGSAVTEYKNAKAHAAEAQRVRAAEEEAEAKRLAEQRTAEAAYKQEQERRKRETFDAHLTSAHNLYQSGKYEEAIKQIELALVINPSDASALRLRNEIEAKRRDERLDIVTGELESLLVETGAEKSDRDTLQEALGLLREAAELAPESPKLTQAQQRVLSRFKTFLVTTWMDRLLETSDKVRPLKRDFVDQDTSLAWTYALRGDFATARKHAEKIRDAGIRATMCARIAAREALSGQLPGAAQTLQMAKKALKSLNPLEDYWLDHIIIAKVEALLGRQGEARKSLNALAKALKRKKEVGGLNLLTANALALIGDAKGAKALVESMDSPFRWGGFTNLGKIFARTGDVKTARRMFDLARRTCEGEAESGSISYLVSLAEAEGEAGLKEDARNALEQVKLIASKSVVKDLLYARIAAIQAKIDDIPAAKKTLSDITTDDKKLKPLIALGEAQVRAGRNADALKTLQTALDLANKEENVSLRIMYYYQIAKAELLAGDKAAFLRTLERAIREIETEGTSHHTYHIAQLLVEAGEFQQAILLAERMSPGSLKSISFYEIVQAAAKEAQYSFARETVGRMMDDQWAHRAFVSVAREASKNIDLGFLETWYGEETQPMTRYALAKGALWGLLEKDSDKTDFLYRDEPIPSLDQGSGR